MMRLWISFFAFVFLIGPQSFSQTKSALFIGNSYTYFNDLPQMVSDIAGSNGDSLSFDSNTPGGFTFQGHSADPVTINKIQSQKWDFVVLQEQSQRPSFPPSQVLSDVYPYAASLNQRIQQNDSCTETMFYMTWGRKYGDQQNCQFYTPLCTYQGMQKRLRESYVEMANLNNASVAPIGMAWKYSIANDSNLNLYNADESHPNVYGSYLSACVLYSSMFYKSSVGLYHPSAIPAGTAYILQNISDGTVFDSLATWRIDTSSSIHPNFSYVQNGATFNFTDNTGLVGVSHNWDFGDGNFSQLQNPVHTYAQEGSYKVSLEVSLKCDVAWSSDSVEVISSNVLEKGGKLAVFYPNPVKDKLTIVMKDNHQSISVKQYNSSGQLVREESYLQEREVVFEMLGPEGFYYMLVDTETTHYSFKILKE